MVFLPWLQQTQHWEQKSRSPGSLLLGTNPSRQDAFSSLVIISSPILPPGVTLKTVYSAPVLMSVPQKKRCWINTEVLSGSSAYTDQALRQLNMCPYNMSTHRDLTCPGNQGFQGGRIKVGWFYTQDWWWRMGPFSLIWRSYSYRKWK